MIYYIPKDATLIDEGTTGWDDMDFIKNPRGLRNNNPGNIRHGNDWKGEKVGNDNAFETFTSVEYGIRAIYKLIDTYANKYNAKSVRDILSRFAPTNENDTNGYIDQVINYMLEHTTGEEQSIVKRNNETVYVHQGHLRDVFVAAIIMHENGMQPFNIEFIRECQKL